ncbi:MAG TPA: hypothetical protein VGG44_04080 [Tepidisphaeraceae bacterium]
MNAHLYEKLSISRKCETSILIDPGPEIGSASCHSTLTRVCSSGTNLISSTDPTKAAKYAGNNRRARRPKYVPHPPASRPSLASASRISRYPDNVTNIARLARPLLTQFSPSRKVPFHPA